MNVAKPTQISGRPLARLLRSTDTRSPTARVLVGLAFTLAVSLLGVVGYVLAGWDWLEGIYMVVITIFGVGYGEVRPLTTWLRLWTIGIIIFGYAAAIYTIGGFVQVLIDGELIKVLGIRRMQRDIEHLRDHVIVCGYGRMGTSLASVLEARERGLIVIDQNPARVKEARAAGFLAIEGNATEEDVLRAAGIERATVLATVLSNDVANVFITITAHEINPKIQIFARAEQSSNSKKLRQVGATRVISPSQIGADRIANMILRPSTESLLQKASLPEGINQDLAAIGLQLDELEVRQGSSLIGGQLSDIKMLGDSQFLIVAVRRANGVVSLNPKPDDNLELGDCVIVLGHQENIVKLCRRYFLQSELQEDNDQIDASTKLKH